jgi:AcrR family transcriptional regulator
MASYSELAAAARTGRTTLRHYFGTHDELLVALMKHWATLGDKHGLPGPVPTSADDAIRRMARWFVVGWRHGLALLVERGIQSGIGHDLLGPVFVSYLLEPILNNFEIQIIDWQEAGELAHGSARHAAIELVSPLLVALLHQDSFRGSTCRPLEIDPFVEVHVTRFLRAWAPEHRKTKRERGAAASSKGP